MPAHLSRCDVTWRGLVAHMRGAREGGENRRFVVHNARIREARCQIILRYTLLIPHSLSLYSLYATTQQPPAGAAAAPVASSGATRGEAPAGPLPGLPAAGGEAMAAPPLRARRATSASKIGTQSL